MSSTAFSGPSNVICHPNSGMNPILWGKLYWESLVPFNSKFLSLPSVIPTDYLINYFFFYFHFLLLAYWAVLHWYLFELPTRHFALSKNFQVLIKNH